MGQLSRVVVNGVTVYPLRGRLCADCLDRPAPDQRRQAKDGRCKICTRELARAKRKRTAARKEANANQTYVAMYDLSEASSWDGEV